MNEREGEGEKEEGIWVGGGEIGKVRNRKEKTADDTKVLRLQNGL